MTEMGLLDPFDLAVIRTTAQHNDIDETKLRDALANHQRTMRENPGVEDLVYEWRKQYDDPILVRTKNLFIVAVPPSVWEEYGDYLDFEGDVLAAVSAVHAEQTLRTEDVTVESLPSERTPIVVGRT